MTPGRAGLLLAGLALPACAVEEWRNADLQLDVSGAGLHDEDRVRLCVDGVGMHAEAVGAGAVAFPGLPAEGPVVVTVDLLHDGDTGVTGDESRLGRAGPVTLGDGAAWTEAAWEACDPAAGDCAACRAPGQKAPPGARDRLLVVRFVE